MRRLECERGDRRLFAPVDLTVGAGDIVWIRGANGRGKTTLLRTLAGLAAPVAGEIVWSLAAEGAARPLYLAHANALKDDLTVAESLRFLLVLQGDDAAPERIDAALVRLGLGHRRGAFVRTLSQGQRRRVALARLAALPDTRPWLLDEPYDALDAAGVACLDGLLVEHARRGGCIMLASHLPLAIADPRPVHVELREHVAA